MIERRKGKRTRKGKTVKNQGHKITAVAPGSIGEELELEPGDVVTVWQKSLSSTDPYIFKPELVESESESASESETETTSEIPQE